ncbi:hypothetical protein TNCV_3764631 [Trichonephila clavipes]|uniref:Paired domain-containing protein n=1 Tax=Trichonephila clavipes TaxID=2585209 RepID=A0A8X7B9P9_TRICX|nr:hypothetical protein TNCV_3764631 [Trichonephila clavipes]
MSARHHIDDFMHGRIIGKIEEGRKITDVAREFDIAHSVVSRLWKSFKTTGMCSRRHGEVVLEVRRLQKTDISSYQQKGTGAPQSAGGRSKFLAASGKQISLKNCCQTFEERGGLYARRPVLCVPLTRQHRTPRLSGTAYRPENIQEKRQISDMQYHGVDRHHDQWLHAPTCGCEWDYDGPTIH